MQAHDLDEYATIVEDSYGDGAQDFAGRMAARFEASNADVELFWRTVEESLARRKPQPGANAAPAPRSPGITRFLDLIFAGILRLWLTFLGTRGSRQRLSPGVSAAQS